MHSVIQHLARFFIGLGGPGLLLLGSLDSSFLFFPLGNDLLLVVLTNHHHERMPYYAAMAAAGSVLGCFLTDFVSRKGGEAGLKGRLSERRLAFVRQQLTTRAGVMLAVASLMPPPFPFTIFVIAAAALGYPRAKLLGVIASARFVRFLIEGWLAILFGRRLLAIAQYPVTQGIVLAIVAVSIGGSAWSIYSWIRRSRSARATA